VQALTWWQHPVASSETQDVLHWVMHPTSCRLIYTATKITSILPALFFVVDYLFAHSNRS
jgi:hypothetical protein